MPLLIALAVAASAQSIGAGEFLSRAEPLMTKSKMALMFSSDARTLMKILGQAAQQNRAGIEAARNAGRPVSACLPPKGKAEINVRELITYLRSLPVAERRQSFDRAFGGYIARKYPCRA